MTSLDRAQSRAVDQLAVAELEIPSIVLMENAGLGATLALLADVDADARPLFGVVCGGGNNGGDGYVVARQLANRGHGVRLFETQGRDELSGDALVNRRIVENMRLAQTFVRDVHELEQAEAELAGCGVLVDALLGTGFRGEPRPLAAAVIRRMNELGSAGARIVALDLPSGFDCDLGAVAEPVVRADLTLTFAARKLAFERAASAAWTGPVQVIPIGVPAELIARVLGSPIE